MTTSPTQELCERLLGYADSLEQQARWVRDALQSEGDFDLGDVDTDELDAAAKCARQSAATIAHLQARVGELEAALRRIWALEEITHGRGPFNRDPLDYAESCIEAMKTGAEVALSSTPARAQALLKCRDALRGILTIHDTGTASAHSWTVRWDAAREALALADGGKS